MIKEDIPATSATQDAAMKAVDGPCNTGWVLAVGG